MTTDQLTDAQKAGASMFLGGNSGWGFGLAVVTGRTELATPGSFGWEGGYLTSGRSDPKEAMTGILMTQLTVGNKVSGEIYNDFWTLAYAAIDD